MHSTDLHVSVVWWRHSCYWATAVQAVIARCVFTVRFFVGRLEVKENLYGLCAYGDQ